MHQKTVLKIHVAVWHQTCFWVPLHYNKSHSWRSKGGRTWNSES